MTAAILLDRAAWSRHDPAERCGSGGLVAAPVCSLPGMKTVVEPLEGNRVKLWGEGDEVELERPLDAPSRKTAREARTPGSPPGKPPRRILEARLGTEAARQEALRDSLPD